MKHHHSYCDRKYYLLPADRCTEAAALFRLAREDAMRAKREIWFEKYGADGAVTGGGYKHRALFFFDHTKALAATAKHAGLSSSIKRQETDGKVIWAVKPNRTKSSGKAIAAELEHVEELLNVWQWALEKSLGIYGTVFADHAFHNGIAKLLNDGRVVASLPIDRHAGRERPGVYSNCVAPVAPAWAAEITEAEYRVLSKQADLYEEEA